MKTLIGSNIKFVKKYYMQTYNISAKDVDEGGKFPHCIYGYKPYFLCNQRLLPSDLSKIGKAKSVYNRLRATSQAGATNRLCWIINVVSENCVSELEKKIDNSFSHKRCFDQRIYANETYYLNELETTQIVYDIIENNKDDCSIINAIVFRDIETEIIYQNSNPYDYKIRNKQANNAIFSNLFSEE